MIVAIVQARVGSTRFPRKVLTDISGATMLERVVERVREARSVERVVVATTTATDDDAVEQLCRRIGVACFRGSEEDVLDRYHAAAHEHGASIVVRIRRISEVERPSARIAPGNQMIFRFSQGFSVMLT